MTEMDPAFVRDMRALAAREASKTAKVSVATVLSVTADGKAVVARPEELADPLTPTRPAYPVYGSVVVGQKVQVLSWGRGECLIFGSAGSPGGVPGDHGPTHVGNGDDPIPNATTTVSGLMSGADKARLGNLLSVAGPEVSISGAAALTASAFGKMHVLSGSANYTVTLPAASGNAGKVIGFRVASSATALVTLDGNGSEQIDGETARVMWSGESALLLCDGAGWTKMAGRFRQMGCRMRIQIQAATPSEAQQIPTNLNTKVLVNQTDFDVGGAADLANNRIAVRRTGRYLCGFVVYYSTRSGNVPTVAAANPISRVIGSITVVSTDAGRNGSRPVQGESSAYSAASFASVNAVNPEMLYAGDYLELSTFQNSGEARWLYGSPTQAATLFWIQELPNW